MRLKEIKELLDFIANLSLGEVRIEIGDLKLEVKQNREKGSTVSPKTFSSSKEEDTSSQGISLSQKENNSSDEVKKVEDIAKTEYITIKSPMIGTFYCSASPEAEPFVKVGDIISKGQVLCIIEAMKLFNEIESEHEGKIIEIIPENTSPVEYDQPLFLIAPVH